MQPGYPGSGQDPYGQQPPYTDPYAQPQYQPQQPQQPPADPTAAPTGQQPEQPPQYQAPYPPPASGEPYPTSGPGYPSATPYPIAGYGAPTGTPQQNNTQGLLAMIFGIVALPGALCCSIVGLGLGIAAVVLGRLGMKKAEAGQASNRGQALAGVICGAIGAVLAIVSIILVFVLRLNNFSFPTAP
ncbi:DUF4190 domain-containing protein [Planosporangium thailandense]|uniref:DUF4190 domain-containing protein n=1 Tax=Planosporangium thailandense TaxID=765197 RepID=A0ABX0XWN8_9ACTN|nr:DUF4190 domain-containing protein [Planosporangium thailandense]NJC70218.1 DUF4190 domain-containing protein [Planosporangium thailandense]